MGHRLGLATRTQISVCKSQFPSAGTAMSLFHAKTVQQRQHCCRGRSGGGGGGGGGGDDDGDDDDDDDDVRYW